MKIRVGIVLFPGSNCDRDVFYAFKSISNFEPTYLWHEDKDVSGCDVVVLPGGFSYGDYLRPGAIATFSNICEPIKELAEKGKVIIGICNGFQVLTELHLLPGALLPNLCGTFICKTVSIKVTSTLSALTCNLKEETIIKLPIAHGCGRYYISENSYLELKKRKQIVFEYYGENPNGSFMNIAGICNERGNVVGLMPHPERASSKLLSNTNGIILLSSIIKYLK